MNARVEWVDAGVVRADKKAYEGEEEEEEDDAALARTHACNLHLNIFY